MQLKIDIVELLKEGLRSGLFSVKTGVFSCGNFGT
jgi:hypothetical protein